MTAMAPELHCDPRCPAAGKVGLRCTSTTLCIAILALAMDMWPSNLLIQMAFALAACSCIECDPSSQLLHITHRPGDRT